jgi:hypothetical protein
MLKWFQSLWVRKAAAVWVPPAAPKAGAWTVHDRDTLRLFLASDLGQKLVLRLRATEYALATAGARDVMHTAHSAGLTVGYGQAILHLLSLSQSAGEHAEKTNDSGAAGEPQPIEREWQETVARMSP